MTMPADKPSPVTIGVVREKAAGERRVALTPDGVGRLRTAGFDVLVAHDAGRAAFFPDPAYAEAGARVVSEADVYEQADAIVCVHAPDAADRGLLRPGQLLLGMLAPLIHPELAAELAAAKVTAISLDGLPRLLSRSQAMDALSSQANVAGYKAALVAADAYGGYFPMFMTAAGTTRPAQVLVIGAGVAGLQALGTARRLGAVVTGYDIRDAARDDVRSTGAVFLNLRGSGPVAGGAGAGGYARELEADEKRAQQAALAAAIGRFDIVITTAQVPGKRPPQLVGADAIAAMKPGSVVLDLAASELGGNVEGSQPDERIVTPNGVTVIGAPNLAAEVPMAASTAYARNMVALLAYLIKDGELVYTPEDEIVAGVVVTHDGDVVHPAVRALLEARSKEEPA